jgi:hypothetical protein
MVRENTSSAMASIIAEPLRMVRRRCRRRLRSASLSRIRAFVFI